MSTSAEIGTVGAMANADSLSNVVEVLQRLHLVPGAGETAVLLQRHAPDGGSPSSDIVVALKSIHTRLLAEASPDFWLDEFTAAADDCDANTMDLAVDAASARLDDAAILRTFIARIESDDVAETPSVGWPATKGTYL